MSRKQHYDTLALTQSSIRLLNLTQRASALSLSSFLLLHLCAPLASTIAPRTKAESYASGFMVLGRVLYQGEWGEWIFVWGSAGVHVLSGVVGRVLKGVERRERSRRRRVDVRRDAEKGMGGEEELSLGGRIVELSPNDDDDDDDGSKSFSLDSTPASPPSALAYLPPISLHQITGYLLLPLAAHHAYLHRLLPSSPSPPISSLSPTLFSYSFVSYSLSSSHALASSIAYVAVLSIGSYHALAGIRRLADPTAPRGLRRRRDGRNGWRVAYVGVVGGVGIGLARLASEGRGVPEWMGRRYEEVLRRGLVF